jgi:hypothetical protein
MTMTPCSLYLWSLCSLPDDAHGEVMHNLAVILEAPIVSGEKVDEVKVLVECAAENKQQW